MKHRVIIQRYPKCRSARKIAYPTRAEAERCGTVLVMLGRWLGKKPYTYHCLECGKWHLTKMKQPEGTQ
jgi:hypothetical protein